MITQQVYSGENRHLINLIPESAQSILDVGCAVGGLGRIIKQKQDCRVVGVENEPKMIQQARQHLDEVIVGDIETVSLPFEHATFDCIVYGDVLEHLRNPWEILKAQKVYLKPNGVAIASIPNVQNVRVIKMLLAGKWEYSPYGIMDSTHLRWFTHREIYKLFEQAGYKNILVKATPLPVQAKLITKLLHKILPGFFTIQFLVVANNNSYS